METFSDEGSYVSDVSFVSTPTMDRSEWTSFFIRYFPPKHQPKRYLTPTKYRDPRSVLSNIVTTKLPEGSTATPRREKSNALVVFGTPNHSKYPSRYPRHNPDVDEVIARLNATDTSRAFHWDVAERLITPSALKDKEKTRLANTPKSTPAVSPALDITACLAKGDRMVTPTKFRQSFKMSPIPTPFNANVYYNLPRASSCPEQMQPLRKFGRLLTPSKYRDPNSVSFDDEVQAYTLTSDMTTPAEDLFLSERLSAIATALEREQYEDSWASLSESEGPPSPLAADRGKKPSKVTFNDTVNFRPLTPLSVGQQEPPRAESSATWDSPEARKWRAAEISHSANVETLPEIQSKVEGMKPLIGKSDYNSISNMLNTRPKEDSNVPVRNFISNYHDHLLVKARLESLMEPKQNSKQDPPGVIVRHPDDSATKANDSLATAKAALLEKSNRRNMLPKIQSAEVLHIRQEEMDDITPNANQNQTAEAASNSKRKQRIFISYSQAQKPIVVATWNRLLPRYDVWIDETHLTGWQPDPIREGVENADLALIFYSENYSKSVSCEREVSVITELQKPFLAINVGQNFEPEGWLAKFLAPQNFVISLRDPVTNEDLNALQAEIEQIIPGN